MASRLQYASHANFSVGMVRDLPRHLLPEGAVFDAVNVVITNSGSLAKRGATVSAISAATTSAFTQIGSQRSSNIDGRSRLYPVGISGGVLKFGSLQFSSSAVAMPQFTTSISASTISTPTQFGSSVVFPTDTDGRLVWAGGADFSAASANYSLSATTATTTAGNNNITIGATAVSNVQIGGYVHLSNATNEYTGRVVAKGSTTVTVEPTPISSVSSYTSVKFYPVLPQVGALDDGQFISAVGCVGTFAAGGDSRLVVGNIKITTTATSAETWYPNRIMWSVGEAKDATISGVDGLVQATRAGFPELNYIDIEDIGQVLALVPLGSSNMLIVGSKQCYMLSGSLLTQQAETASTLARGGLTASLRGFPQQVGCIDARSVQRTASGVMFAAADGVYITDGSALVNTMTNKISNFYSAELAGNALFTFDLSLFNSSDVFAPDSGVTGVYGSANINDSHYYLSLASGGFLCDLRAKFGWTRVNSGEVEIASSATDADQTTNRVYAVKYGADTSVSSVDRVIRIDPVVSPAATTTDADSTVIESTIVTKAYTEGDPAQKRRYRHTMIAYKLLNGDFSVQATAGLDGQGSTGSIGSTTSNGADVDRYDHQTLSQAVTYTISTSNSPDSFELYEITNAFNQLRPGRIT